MKPSLKKPQALKAKDIIRVVASSSPFEKDHFESGIGILQSFGYQTRFQKNIFAKKHYLAGNDVRRLQELVAALNDDKAKAIFFARGGYGAMRLLPALDHIKIKSAPKIVLGYSDITSLLIYLYQKLGWVTFYGPVVAKDISTSTDEETLQALQYAIASTQALDPLQFDEVIALKKGDASATLVGGCLSLIVAHMGTPYDLNTNDKILFLEDTNEKPYAIDRMLTQMKLGGKFKKCRGIVFGSLAGANPLEHYQETILDIFKDHDFPILFNFPAGHSQKKITLPLGIRVKISSRERSLTFLESALKGS